MMTEDKKSWFIPPDFKAKDIQPLFVGNVPFDKKEVGFYHTGEYFLANEDPWIKIPDTVRIHIIEFDKSSSTFLQNVVTVRLRSCVGYYKCDQFCFYPDVGFLLHTIERYSSDGEYFTNDLYGYHIINWFEMNRNNIELCMDLKPSPDLSLRYASEFRFLSYHYHNIIGNNKRLIISAFSQRTVDEANGPSPALYRSLCLDFLNIELQQIKQEKRLVIELDRPLENSFVFRYFTKDKIYFERIGNKHNTIKSTILEYDYSGKFLYSYSIEYPDSLLKYFECIRNLNLIFLYNRKTKPEDLEIRVIKLEKGKAEIIKEVRNIIFPKEEGVMYKSVALNDPIKRFNHIVLPALLRDDVHGVYMTLDLTSMEITRKSQRQNITEDDNIQAVSLNWNNEEIAMISLNDEEYLLRGCEFAFVFQITHNNTVEGKGSVKSLKQLARFAVLTSFNYDQLMEANLPSTLFDYLGIEM